MKKITQNFYQAKTKNKVSQWLLVFALLLTVYNVEAAIKTSVGSGAWDTAANWSPAGKPGSSDDVIIAVGHVITAPASNISVNTLTVYGSLDTGLLKITTASDFIIGDGVNTASVTIGTQNNGGVLINGTGNLTINALATLTMNSNFVVPGTTTISGTVNLTNIGSSRTSTFTGDFTLNPGAVWNDTSGTGSARTDNFAGNFINNASTYTVAANGIKGFSGTGKTISGATLINAATVNVTGTVTLASGTELSANTALSGAGTLTNLGVLNIKGASAITGLNAATAGNTVNYNGVGNQTVKATAYANLGLGNASSKTILTGTTVTGGLTISGTAIANITTGGIIQVGSLTLGATVQASGASYGGASSGAANIDPVYFALTTSGNYIDVLVLGTNDFKAESSSNVYANGNQIFVSNVKSNTTVTVYSLTGALVKTVETTADASFNLESGIYVVKVKSAESEKSVKLLVK